MKQNKFYKRLRKLEEKASNAPQWKWNIFETVSLCFCVAQVLRVLLS